MKCPNCKKIMKADYSWSRESYHKISNLIEYNCDCGFDKYPSFSIATESNIVKILCDSKNIIFNKIGLLLCYDYQYIDSTSGVKRGYVKE